MFSSDVVLVATKGEKESQQGAAHHVGTTLIEQSYTLNLFIFFTVLASLCWEVTNCCKISYTLPVDSTLNY